MRSHLFPCSNPVPLTRPSPGNDSKMLPGFTSVFHQPDLFQPGMAMLSPSLDWQSGWYDKWRDPGFEVSR